MPIPNSTRQIIRERADFLCEYCHSSEKLNASRGVTPIGRATCDRFDLNDMRYPEGDSIRSTRQFWIQTGLHPPASDPMEM